MTSVALIVGIDVYPSDTKMTALHGAVADAADFADWALNPAGGNVAPEDLYLWTHPEPVNPGPNLRTFMLNPTRWPLVGPEFGQAPKAIDIIRCIAKLAEKCGDIDAERLYVFFAGHGAQTRPDDHTEDPQNCFIAADFAADMPAVGLVGCDDLRRYLVRVGPRELVLFFDCCRNALPLKVGRPPSPYNKTNEEGVHERLAVGRAAQDACVAYEIPMDTPKPNRGAFSKLLVGGLREHRVNGRLTLHDLEEYVTAGIADLVKPPNSQFPDFIEKPKPPAIVLVSGPPLIGALDLRLTFATVALGGRIEIRDVNNTIVIASTITARTHTYPLPIGSYSVDFPDDGRSEVFNHLGPGVTDVEI